MHRVPPQICEALDSARLMPIPQVLARLLTLVDDDQASVAELASVVGSDPALSARILTAANSAALRRGRELRKLADCLVALGTRLVKTIAVSLSVQSVVQKLARGDEWDVSGLWYHSLLVAEISRAIAVTANYRNVDEAYLTGLLHDIGEVALAGGLPRQYRPLIRQAVDEATLVDLEQRQLETNHGAVGAWIADQWQFESFLADAILFHHSEPADVAFAEPLTRIVWTAHACAEGKLPTEPASAGMTLDAEALLEIRRQAMTRVDALATAMGIGTVSRNPDDPAQSLLRCLIPEMDSGKEGRANDPVIDALAGSVLLQPLQQNLFTLESNAEILLSLRESARILFGVAQMAFLLPTADGKNLSGARVGGQPPLLQRLEIPLDPARSLPALAAARGDGASSFETGATTPSLIDVMLARALGTDGILCLAMHAGTQLEGVMVFGLSSQQQQRLAKRMPWLASFARIAAVSLEAWRRAREDRKQIEAEVAGRFKVKARQVAHEAGNPLSIIRNYLGVLGQRLDGDLKNELGILNEELDRVTKIVRGLSELENGPRDGGATDVNLVIREMLAIYREPLFDSCGIELDLNLDPRLEPADLPRDPFKQILLNLWKNASEAMPHGGRLAVSTLAAIGNDGVAQLELVVGDSGPGLPEDVLARLYQPLGAERKSGHQGLGLSIVSKLVRQLGGQVSCASRPGMGTRFTLLLPRPPAAGQNHAKENSGGPR